MRDIMKTNISFPPANSRKYFYKHCWRKEMEPTIEIYSAWLTAACLKLMKTCGKNRFPWCTEKIEGYIHTVMYAIFNVQFWILSVDSIVFLTRTTSSRAIENANFVHYSSRIPVSCVSLRLSFSLLHWASVYVDSCSLDNFCASLRKHMPHQETLKKQVDCKTIKCWTDIKTREWKSAFELTPKLFQT